MSSGLARSGRPKILVLGAGGMLGNAVLRYVAERDTHDVVGSVRVARPPAFLPAPLQERILTGIDVENVDRLAQVLAVTRPDVVINCIGIVKQLEAADNPLHAIPVNSLLPHRLANLCDLAGARLVHISTDCVFSGSKGGYREDNPADAQDLYGQSKYLGEVDYPHALTLRTSIIGHEYVSARGLLEWFLSQQGSVKGYTRAVFSGLPTVELARVIHDFVLPNRGLRGVYHVAAEPINKYDLLKLVAEIYRKEVTILPDDQIVIDRSLDASRFREATGYTAPPWRELVSRMHAFH
jgi:dTDP-4-dehydrorhamnose reductase